MRVASVILDIPTQALDAPYWYLVPENAGDDGDYPIEVGCAVVVPLGPRQVVGFVVEVCDCEPDEIPGGLDPKKLRPVKRTVSSPYFDEEGAACAQWLARRYLAPLSECVRLFTPPGGVPRMVRAREGYWRLERPKVGEVDDRWVTLGPAADGFTPRKNAVKQALIIDALKRGDLRAAELTAEYGNVSSTLKALADKGVVTIERRRRLRVASDLRGPANPMFMGRRTRAWAQADGGEPSGVEGQPDPASEFPADVQAGPGMQSGADDRSSTVVQFSPDAPPDSTAESATEAQLDASLQPDKDTRRGRTSYAVSFMPSAKPELTQGQADALAAIKQACDRGDGSVVLVDGVTGSGKTEVYLQAIEDVLERGRTACVLVPEIALTPQTVARFRGRFGDGVAVMHSRMGVGERYDQWDYIRSGAARVVVGARSALFTPLSNVGLIVIDEEHESSYKQDSAPRYHARDVAVFMARRSGAAVVLGSATPSIESLYLAAKDPQWTQVSLPERANGRPMPEVQVVDMAREFAGGSRSMFSRELSRALEHELSCGHKAVLLLNQRGFAKFVLCRDCGFVPTCPSCSTSLTYHERGNLLICHHCGHRVTAMPTCPQCNSPYLRKFGAGTQRVEDELHALIASFSDVPPDIPVIRMDADTTSGKDAHRRLLEQFAASHAAVLLGTQMIAKGLDFDDVTLVGVINADTQLHLPDYRAAERTFSLIEQVAGRAGRAELDGRVLVQTYQADAVAIRAAAAYDRRAFLRDELPKRKVLGYPPYVRLVNMLVWGADEQAVRASAEGLRDEVSRRVRDYAGPGWKVLAAAPCVLAKLNNVYRWHILLKAPADADVSGVLLPFFRTRKVIPDVNVAVDVDPMSLL